MAEISEKPEPATEPTVDATSKETKKETTVSASRGRKQQTGPQVDADVLLKSLWLLPSLVWTSYSAQTLVKPLLGANLPSMYFHFATFLSVGALSLVVKDDPTSKKRALEIASVLQIATALTSRTLASSLIAVVGDPLWASLILHCALGLPALGFAGAVWLQYMNKFAEIDEPTLGGQLIYKTLSCIALSTIISFTESLLGRIILKIVYIPPSTALLVLAVATHLLSGTTGVKSIKPPVDALSRTAILITLLVAGYSVVLPPYKPRGLNILSQTYTANGLIQVGESRLGMLPVRYLRQDASIVGAVTVEDDGSLGDTMSSASVLVDTSRFVKGLKGKKALVLGTGTGYNVKTLIARGYNTTAVEFDREIYNAARTHFGMPEPNVTYIGDALHYVWDQETLNNRTKDFKKFDIIQHDLFTEGVLPATLFNVDFFGSIKLILDPNGVFALMYTGKPRSITMKSTVNMLRKSFKTCRAFHPSPLPESPLQPFRKDEIVEIVIFCTHAPELEFNQAKQSEYKDSPLREGVVAFLRDRELDFNKILEGTSRDTYILKTTDPKMQSWGTEFIAEHWKQMREEYPAGLWSTY